MCQIGKNFYLLAATISEVPSGFLLKFVHVLPQFVLPPLALVEVEKANGQEGEVGHDQEQGQQEAKVQNCQVSTGAICPSLTD